jgi:3,4-dihydroxy 2-butanone 4-phosphate synthase / GTP cyclohydrolase II
VDLFRPDPADHRVRAALTAIADGLPVVVVDDVDRENEGDLIFAASRATSRLVAFTVRHTSGFVCVAMPGEDCDRLGLPPMRAQGGDRFGTAYRVTVDLRGTGTGISATSRATTIAALSSPHATAADFLRPGHVVPLMARPGGVLERRGHTEAAVDLTRLAGLPPAGALSEIVSEERPGEMARGAELERFADRHALALLSIADLVRYRRWTEPQVQRAVSTSLPTAHGTFRALGYRALHDSAEHMALLAGEVDGDGDVPVYVHRECLSGDVLRSTACACGHALDDAMARFAAAGRGVIVYLRPAGAAQACGLLDVPERDGIADAAVADGILADLGVHPRPDLRTQPPARLDEWIAARRRPASTPGRIAG